MGLMGVLKKIVLFPVYVVSWLYHFIREKNTFSIRMRLSLRYTVILTLALSVCGVGFIATYSLNSVYSAVSSNHTDFFNLINTKSPAYPAIEEFAQTHSAPVVVYDLNENVQFASDPAYAQYGYQNPAGIVHDEHGLWLAVNRQTVIDGAFVRVLIYTNITEIAAQTVYVARLIVSIFVPVLLVALILVIAAGGGIFEPIRNMTRTVKHISERNLTLRLNVSGSKNELKELALTFNEMMNRIEDQYNRQKQFVSDASHELRTPIAVIQGYVSMLDRWGKNDQEVLQESIAAIKNEADNMNELIDKLLFLARHDNNTFELQKEEFSMTEMLSEIVKETQIIDPSHRFAFDINTELSICGDKNRLKQALRIFIDNAIKYTPAHGEIAIKLGKENRYITVSIKDTGIGMTEEDLKYIFDRFYRSDKSRTKEKGGHGLGLAIAKIIILGHKGKIKVRSRVGEGSEFIIMLEQGVVSDAAGE